MTKAELAEALKEIEVLQDTVFALYKKHKRDSILGSFYAAQNNQITDMRIHLEHNQD